MKVTYNKDGKIIVLSECYSDELIDALYKVSKHIVMPPSTFYINYVEFLKGAVWNELQNFFPKQFTQFLAKHLELIVSNASIDFKDDYGFEVWIGSSDENSKTPGYLHIDNDECQRSRSGILSTPILGSILYLTPKEIISGGETIIFENSPSDENILFQHHSKAYLTNQKDGYISEAKAGNLTLFQGDYPHAVLPYQLNGKNNPRVNVMVNVWAKRIESVPNGFTYLQPN